jgi:hypothetical protein
MISLHRINARDRRKAAAHEAGHIVIAEHLGIDVARSAIWPTPREDALSEKLWGGQIQVFAGSESRLEIWRAIGIAGIVAEDVLCETSAESAETTELYHWDYRFDYAEAMSLSDWQLCRAEPGVDADELADVATQVAELLLVELREKLIKTARRLIIEARTATPIN